MSIKQFRKKLIKIIENSDQFITYTNEDICFEDMEDNQIVVCGEDSTEVFTFEIIKV